MRVTEAAQHAVTQAKREAGRLGHDRVGTEHLLLGLQVRSCLAVAGRRIHKVHDLGSRTGPLTRGSAGA